MLNLLRRALVLALGVAFLAVGADVLAVASGFAPPNVLAYQGVTLSSEALDASAWAPIGGVLALLGLASIVLAVWPQGRRGAHRITLPPSIVEDGLKVRVSEKTLRALVTYEAHQVKGVREVRPEVSIDENGWSIRCALVVWRGVSMREVAEEVTERLRDALHHHTGVNLANLDLDVALVTETPARIQ